MNGRTGEWFRTIVGVGQRCRVSPTLFKIISKGFFSDALEEYDGNVSTGGETVTNLGCAYVIDALAEEE